MSAPAAPTLEIRSSPHIVSGHSVDVIMWNVVAALMPVSLFAVWAFGLAAASLLVASVATCVAIEHLLSRLAGRPTTVADGSVVITGLLLGLTLPPGLPLWMAVVGGVVSVGLGKAAFGGLGANPFNPALVGRTFLQAAFPAAMTTWTPAFADGRFTSLPTSTLAWPFAAPVYDALSGATPLARWKFEGVLTGSRDLALGLVGGSAGETCFVLALLGGLYLIARNMMSWRVPVAIFGTVFLLSGALHLADPERFAPPLFMVLSGGLALGALFMATDMVGSPMTHLGMWIYGALIGGLVVVIRAFGGMPEGVMYAILLGNAMTPHLDRSIRPRVYGTGGARG